MKNWLSAFLDKYFAPALDLRMQTFNLLALVGMTVSLVTALVSFATGVAVNGFIILALLGLAIFLLRFARATHRYDLCCRVTVIVVFLIAFPVMFFTAGGYYSGMPCYFIFALIFTSLLLTGRERVAALAAEMFLYVGVCLVAYFRPGSVALFEAERDAVIDIITGLVASSGMLLMVILLYIRIYNNRQRQLEELDRLKTEFYQDMHHEMKSPLNVICSYVQNADDMLDFGADRTEIRDKLESAQHEIIRLARMIENSLDLAAMQVKRKHMEPLDFVLLLRQSAGVFRTLIERDGKTLQIQVPDGLSPVVGNADMLSGVIFNLMYNAYRHTPSGGIFVSLERTDDALKTVIRDTGEGIHPDLLPRVFERGVSAKGTGYGLSISKAILETHGGSIAIESELGKGTAVTFTLPLQRT